MLQITVKQYVKNATIWNTDTTKDTTAKEEDEIHNQTIPRDNRGMPQSN